MKLKRCGWSMILFSGAVLGQAMESAAHGFPNVNRTPGELLAGPVDPNMGRAGIVAWHGERIVVVPEGPGSIIPPHDVLMRVIDINDPSSPQVTALGSYAGGIHAHAYFQSGNHLFVGGHCASANGLSPCGGNPGDHGADSLRIGSGPSGSGINIATSSLQRATMSEDIGLYIGSYHRMATQAPWGANDYWTYNAIDTMSFLGLRRGQADYIYGPGDIPNGPGIRQVWNHRAMTGNVRGFAFLMGNILIYASDQSGSGVATYDVSDLTNPPVLLDVLHEQNPGGYWPEIYGHYIFFPRRDAAEEGLGGILSSKAGFMVVDFSDPTDLRIVADVELPGSNQYVTFQDEYAFMNNYKIDLTTFSPVLTLATNNVTLDASQFALPVGNLVVTGGYGTTGPGIAIWAHQAEPDTRGPWVAYHIPRPDQTNYSLECPITLSIPETLRTETIINGTSLVVRPLDGPNAGVPLPIWHSFGQGKLLTVTPQQPLQPNRTYEVVLTADIEDAAGNPMEPYAFRFSTGNNLSGGNTPPTITHLAITPEVAAPGVQRTISWSGADAEPGVLQYRISLGDGTPRTDWSTNTSINHPYNEEGHFGVLVQVRDSAGSIGAFSRGITVVNPPSEPNSTASSNLARDPATQRIFAVNPDNDTVSAIDADTLAKLWEVPTATRPETIARASDGTLWVTCRESDALDVLSPADGSLVQRITFPYGTRPAAIAPVNGINVMLVTGEGSQRLHRFSTITRSETGSLVLGPWPRGIAVNQSGTRALVTRFISPENTGEVYDVSLAGSMSLTGVIRLRRDLGPDGAASSRGVPNYLAGIRIDPQGEFAWVVGKKDNTTRGTFHSAGQPLAQDNTVRAQLHLIDLATGLEIYSRRMDIDNSDSPSAVTFSPLGDYAYIALQGNAQLAVIDVLDFSRPNSAGTVLARWQVGIAPQGVLVDPATERVFVNNFMDRTVSVFDAQPFHSGSTGVPAESTIDVVTEEKLHEDVLLGKQIFYHASDRRMSAEGYMSCATCHAGGGHDGRTFDFTNRGEGFRNTTDLRGRSGTFHGNVHWSANFDEIQDFEQDMRSGFGGSGFLPADFVSVFDSLGPAKAGHSPELDALAAYVTSLGSSSVPRSPHRQNDGSLSPAAIAGAALFNAHGCAVCHVPSADYTDRLMHNVGTLRSSSGQRLGAALTGIKTPTLLGLHHTAPYFHDGSAATLEQVFTLSGGRLAQAETGTRSGNAVLGDAVWKPMKDWQQGNYVEFQGPGTLTFSDVTSSIAGPGFIELRHSNNNFTNITLTVNGANIAAGLGTVPGNPNSPNFVHNSWRTTRINVNWQAGVNTVAISAANVGLDSLLFATAGDLAVANAHVRGFTPQETGDILAYLMSLDGNNAALPALTLHRDGPINPGDTDTVAIAAGEPHHDLVYSISNTGTGPLNIGRLHLNASPGSASVVDPGESTVLPGGQTTITIRLENPTVGTNVGVATATDAPGLDPLQWTIVVNESETRFSDWSTVE